MNRQDAEHFCKMIMALADGKKVLCVDKRGNKHAASCIYTGNSAEDYSIAPATHVVNGFTVPEPLREAPEVGARYWEENPSYRRWTSPDKWDATSFDKIWLERGLIHLTEAAAVANAKAKCGIDPEWKS